MRSVPPSEPDDPTHITVETTIDAPRARVWEAVSTPEQVNRWWCGGEPVEVELDRSIGGRYEEHYRGDEAEHYDLVGRLIAFEPEHRLVIRRETGGRFGEIDYIEISLDDGVEGTTVRLTHGFPHLPGRRRPEVVDFYEEPWIAALEALESVVTGIG